MCVCVNVFLIVFYQYTVCVKLVDVCTLLTKRLSGLSQVSGWWHCQTVQMYTTTTRTRTV